MGVRYETMRDALADVAEKSGGKPFLILMVAPPGAGKTTLTQKYAEQLEKLGVEVVSTDELVVEIWKNDPAGNGLSYEKAYKKYYREGDAAATGKIMELCAAGKSVLVDRCNLENRRRFLSAAREKGMFSSCFVLPVSEQECVERNALRGERAVPLEAIRGNCKRGRWSGASHADEDEADLVCVIDEAAERRE